MLSKCKNCSWYITKTGDCYHKIIENAKQPIQCTEYIDFFVDREDDPEDAEGELNEP